MFLWRVKIKPSLDKLQENTYLRMALEKTVVRERPGALEVDIAKVLVDFKAFIQLIGCPRQPLLFEQAELELDSNRFILFDAHSDQEHPLHLRLLKVESLALALRLPVTIPVVGLANQHGAVLTLELDLLAGVHDRQVDVADEWGALGDHFVRAKLIFILIQMSIHFDDLFFLIYLRATLLGINLEMEHCEAFYAPSNDI